MKSTFLIIFCSAIKLVLLVSYVYSRHVFGMYINGTEIMAIEKIGQKKCGQHCSSITGCLAYNYDREMLRCHLLADNSSTGTLIESEKKMYENRENIPPDMYDLCKNPDCPMFTQCVKLISGKQTCVRTVCDEPPSPFVNKEAAALKKRFPVGTTLQYQCKISGTTVTKNMTCKADGNWTPVDQQCECGGPFLPFETIPICKHFGCEAQFICKSNAIVEGNNRMTWDGNSGTWIQLDDYHCVPSGCGPPDPVVNSRVFGVRCTSTKCTATYICDINYGFLDIMKLSTCYLSGPRTWSDPALQCHYDCATNRPVVPFSTSDPGCSSTCTYSCLEGYTLIGESVRHCSVDKGWDKEATLCEEVENNNRGGSRK